MFSKVFEYFSPNYEQTQSRLTGAALLMCIFGVLFYAYEYYLRVAPSVMAVELKQTFDLGEAAFGYLAAFYYYAYVLMQIPVGLSMDRFGPRRMLTFACSACVLGTYLFANTTSALNAQIGRLMIGFGSAFAYVGVLKIASVWLPKRYFGLVAGICTALGMLGAISGEMIMTMLVESIGWRATLFYAACVGTVLTGALWLVLRDTTHTTNYVLPIETDTPLEKKLDSFKAILTSRQIWISGSIGCLTFLPITAFAEIWSISFLETAGMSKSEAAMGSAMVFLGFAVGAPVWGIVSNRLKSRRIPMILGSLLAACFMALLVWHPNNSIFWMYSLLLLTSFFASVEVLVFAVSDDASMHSVNATAIAFTNMLVMLGGAFLPPMIGKILDQRLQLMGDLTISDYSIALMVLPIALLLAAVLSFLLKETYQKD